MLATELAAGKSRSWGRRAQSPAPLFNTGKALLNSCNEPELAKTATTIMDDKSRTTIVSIHWAHVACGTEPHTRWWEGIYTDGQQVPQRHRWETGLSADISLVSQVGQEARVTARRANLSCFCSTIRSCHCHLSRSLSGSLPPFTGGGASCSK